MGFDPFGIFGGGSSSSVSSTMNLNVNGLNDMKSTVTLGGALTVNENIDLKPVTVNSNIDLKPLTVNSNIDVKPLALTETIDLKPISVSESIDLKPVAVDTCQTFRLAPLPDTDVCQPYRHNVSYKLFGVELWAACYDGESTQRIKSPRRPQVVERLDRGEHPHHGGSRRPETTGRGIRVRVLDEDER